ncbi:MAG: hypothetical protein NT076_02780 [Candidatus Pacearchaeota archaeon]|nr:hypothetical protein [Candidatus Pacearchaeota archaeon]
MIIWNTPHEMTHSKIGVYRAGKPYLGRADARMSFKEAVQTWRNLVKQYSLKLVQAGTGESVYANSRGTRVSLKADKQGILSRIRVLSAETMVCESPEPRFV